MAAQEPGVFTHAVPNRTTAFVTISIVFVILTTVFFAFRQGWRWAHRQRGMDDAMAACAYLVLVIQTIFGGISAHYGFGKHMSVVLPTVREAMFYFYLYQICYKLLGGFTKLTFCFLYLRIFNQKGFHRMVIAVAAIVATGSLAFALGTVFQCLPVNRAWDRTEPGRCIDNTAFWYTHAAFNTFWDIVIFVMPIPQIRTLKLARGQKTGLISIFSLGAFVIAASIVRMVMLRSSSHSTDPTWGSVVALMWTEIEANTSVIVCCLPALRVPFLNIWHQMRGAPRSPTPDMNTPVRQIRRGAWGGPQWSESQASHLPDRPLPHTSKATAFGLGSTATTTLRSGDTWYDKVLHSLVRDKDVDPSRRSSNSQDELARTEAAMPPRLELGAIYKTTDVHVSMQDQRRVAPEPERGARIGLREMLGSSR